MKLSYSTRESFQIYRNLSKVSKGSHLPSEMYLYSDVASTDEAEAELFNRYFQSVFSNQQYNDAPSSDGPTKLNSIHFTTTEIKDVLERLDTNKAKGPDRISNKILKNLASSLSKSLLLLFNTIVNKASLPRAWKQSGIIPIYKEGDKQKVSNYRPISSLSSVSRVLEKLIFDKFYSVVSPHLSAQQHDFHKKRSTITNLIEYLHQLYLDFDNPTTD